MNKPLLALIFAGLLLFSLSAWSASTKEEIIELKAQVTEMQKDLAEIKKLLKEGARAPAAKAAGFRPQTISIGDSPIKGKVDAPITVVEYSDYQCPFCARNYRDVLPKLQEEYIDTGKLRFVMREYPLSSIHRDATNASIAALCAGDQGKYWEMHDQMFENQKQLGVDNLKSFADTIGLDTTTFNECLDSKKTEGQVRKDMASAGKLGMGGTPGFFIGLTDLSEPDKVELSVYLKGAKPIDAFRAAIDDLLDSFE
ncbi:DsbA family protein [Pseudomonadota bacterium]